MVGIEHIEELVVQSISNVNEWNPNIMKSGYFELVGKLKAKLNFGLSNER